MARDSLTPLNAALLGLAIAVSSLLVSEKRKYKRQDDVSPQEPVYEKLIGSTQLVRLDKLSGLVGRSIWVKMESMNPGATGKDRAALGMLQEAERQKMLPPPALMSLSSLTLKPQPLMDQESNPMMEIVDKAFRKSRTGGIVVEGTSGSTGIALANLSAARGHACLVVLPDDQASEKQAILRALGAVVYVVPTAAISNPNHYVNIARRLAEKAQAKGIQAAFMNQFENEANFDFHYRVTGPELWDQFHAETMRSGIFNFWRGAQQLSAFVMSAGTGGTISGVGKHLKERSTGMCRVVLVDPPGSSLYNKVKHGVAFAPQQREQKLQRHRYDTIAEGIGLDRVTHNLSLGLDFVDDAIAVSDQEAVDMAHFLLQVEGLWVGSSSAMNIVGAIRVALGLEATSNVVTIVCDSGSRHVTRMWNRDFVTKWGLEWPGDAAEGRTPDCLKELIA